MTECSPQGQRETKIPFLRIALQGRDLVDSERLILLKKNKKGSWDAAIVRVEVHSGKALFFDDETLDHMDDWVWNDTDFYIELGVK